MVSQPVRVPLHFCRTFPEHWYSLAAHVGALQVASAGSQICPVAQGSTMFLPSVHDRRELEPVQTHAESGAHSTHLPGAPVQTGVAVGHSVSTQEPVDVLQVLNAVLEVHLAGELALHPAQAP